MLRHIVRPLRSGAPVASSIRAFTNSSISPAQAYPPRPKPPPESEIEESYVKGSGPGGQKINKTNSAVQLQHIPTGIVVKSQATRSRDQNRKHARELLAQRIDELRNGDQSRSALVGQIKKRKSDSASKKSRRKYKKLEEEKATTETGTAATAEPTVGDAEPAHHVESFHDVTQHPATRDKPT
ncbi:hypothetical protein FZEAL_3742 [Fusarium zealandicum]|uniref:Prokaryotic-type class I peptide chain release factors domain-containing protein n=1 Tax=Fusarium zealandicum TaxID=1053134 RepID=A0A8H4XML8_9HYPO|nr:hypothetical protein FZEAL_3742 [Fusarium zealandicum]